MLLMGIPPKSRVVVGSEYGIDQHKSKACSPVNMQRRAALRHLRGERPAKPHLPIEQRLRLR
jgi:hypothetical protein